MREFSMSAALASAATLCVSPAFAQNSAPVPVMPTIWAGYYAGVTAGFGGTTTKWTDGGLNGIAWSQIWGPDRSGSTGTRSGTAHGGVFGGYAGYNFLVSPDWLLGGEVDLTVIGGSSTIHFDSESSVLSDAHLQGSVRGRLGYVTGPYLFYATLGLAFANPEARWNEPVSGASWVDKGWKAGVVGGVGVEYAMMQNIILRLEGLAYKYGGNEPKNLSPASAGASGYSMGNRFSSFEVRAGIAYKF